MVKTQEEMIIRRKRKRQVDRYLPRQEGGKNNGRASVCSQNVLPIDSMF